MVWLHRFLMGLPARLEDLNGIKKDFPELLDGFSNVSDAYDELLHVRYLIKSEEFDKWIRNVRKFDEFPIQRQAEQCSLLSCPLKQKQTVETGSDEKDEIDEDEIEINIAHFMAASGGKKEPRGTFFDLVRIVHGGAKPPIKIFITDPYLYANGDGLGGGEGYDCLKEYLRALRLDRSSNFSLFTTSSPKSVDLDSVYDAFKSHIQEEFQNCHFNFINTKHNFHDRFFLVEHNGGDRRGVFGPSLNGLNSDSIVLMGEITKGPRSLDFLFKAVGE